MHTAPSANRPCNELRSASEYTATVDIPSSLQAQMTRRAISPRLATRIFWNIEVSCRLLFAARANAKERLAVLHWLAVLHEDAQHFAADVRLDFVHELHGFHDAQRLPGVHVRADLQEGFRARAGSLVVRPN